MPVPVLDDLRLVGQRRGCGENELPPRGARQCGCREAIAEELGTSLGPTPPPVGRYVGNDPVPDREDEDGVPVSDDTRGARDSQVSARLPRTASVVGPSVADGLLSDAPCQMDDPAGRRCVEREATLIR